MESPGKITQENLKSTLVESLSNTGLDKEDINKFEFFINKIRFSNIDINQKDNKIHIDMLASLLLQQSNKHLFLQNILKKINQEWEQINEVLITTTSEVEDECIDLNIGANRRVDKFTIIFNDKSNYCFTLSADINENINEKESNSYAEKEIFESEISQDNPWLQEYFGYIDKKISNRNYRMIAKEYLPGKNIIRYCDELKEADEMVEDFCDVACETAYSMSGLYKKMNGQILDDLKLENLIYNCEEKDSDKPLCRICDHSGYYDGNNETKSVNQILAHVESLITVYYKKSKYLGEGNNADNIRLKNAVYILESYLESFLEGMNIEQKNIFIKQVEKIRQQDNQKRFLEIRDDVLDFVLNNY